MSKDEKPFDLLGKDWDDIPNEVEAEQQYPKIAPGIYTIAFGRMTPKFKDINGKSCEQGTPGSSFAYASIPLWLIENHGTSAEPLKEIILGSGLVIPENKKVMELYYNLFISWEKKDQWKNVGLFKNFKLPDIPLSEVVIPNPSGQGKVCRLKSLQYYYGHLMSITVLWSDKGNPYIDTKNSDIKILPTVIPIEKMQKFELEIKARVEKERDERQKNSESNSSYTPPAQDFNEDAGNLDDFLNGEDS